MTSVSYIIKNFGFIYLFRRFIFKITSRRIKGYMFVKSLFNDKSGIEIGGPSPIFRDKGILPLYRIVKNLDGCNFSNTTIWEGNIEAKKNYNYYNEKNGFQYISEASDLNTIPDSKYDFVISSNCLEHVANPLKAFEEWIRIVKKEGLLLLVLPNKKYSFDHKRSVTAFTHLLNDYKNVIKEDDLSHLNEILQCHDLKRDILAGSIKQFKERSLDNYNNRALHHHVFDLNVMCQIFEYFNIEILLTHGDEDYVVVGRKKS